MDVIIQLKSSPKEELSRQSVANVVRWNKNARASETQTAGRNRLSREPNLTVIKKKKLFLQTKVQDQMASLGNSTKHIKRNLYQSFSNSSKRKKRREDSQSHSTKPSSP